MMTILISSCASLPRGTSDCLIYRPIYAEGPVLEFLRKNKHMYHVKNISKSGKTYDE